jgi:hypothetical protein
MLKRSTLVLSASLLAVFGTQAAELKPGHGHSLSLGEVRGSLYYVMDGSDLRMVATLSADEQSTPVRVIATLAPGQMMVLSSPGPVNKAAAEAQIVREGDRLLVLEPKATN